ncbi:MAG: hypothetical protein B6244_11305 [Candidatus Cloacimonetes bacterium 4572_55]|nr:MAG: hypothetical protein B6244_11305 [Candidatus Cloacimonetes bacterium 4572_55]
MHILMIPSWYEKIFSPYAATFFKSFALALKKIGHDVGVISVVPFYLKECVQYRKFLLHKIELPGETLNGEIFQYLSIPKSIEFNRWLIFQIQKRMLKKYMAQYGIPDIVHVHSFSGGRGAIWLSQKYQIPYIVTEHSTMFARNIYSQKDLYYANDLYKNSQYNFAVSNEFCHLLERITKNKFSYIPNAVDIDFFTPPVTKMNQVFTFLNVGWLHYKKRQDLLIKAFIKKFNNRNAKLIIAGDGPELLNLEKLIVKNNMQKKIELYGLASPLEVKTLMQNANCFVLSSEFETFGVVLIEAMSCGLPVVATRSGGPESIITNESVGILCDSNDLDGLSTAMKKVYSSNYDPISIRNFVIDNFSEAAIMKKYDSIYNMVLRFMD